MQATLFWFQPHSWRGRISGTFHDFRAALHRVDLDFSVKTTRQNVMLDP